MQTSPTGGLSLFINLSILIIGFILKYVKRVAILGALTFVIYSGMTDKKHDYFSRRFLSYGLALSIFSFVFVTTSFSIYNRLTHESNYDLIAQKVSELMKEDNSTVKDNEPYTSHRFNIQYLAVESYLLAFLK